MTKRIISTAGIIAVMLTLTACDGENLDTINEKHFTTKVIPVDGREVKCLLYQNAPYGGLSCDWDGAR